MPDLARGDWVAAYSADKEIWLGRVVSHHKRNGECVLRYYPSAGRNKYTRSAEADWAENIRSLTILDNEDFQYDSATKFYICSYDLGDDLKKIKKLKDAGDGLSPVENSTAAKKRKQPPTELKQGSQGHHQPPPKKKQPAAEGGASAKHNKTKTASPAAAPAPAPAPKAATKKLTAELPSFEDDPNAFRRTSRREGRKAPERLDPVLQQEIERAMQESLRQVRVSLAAQHTLTESLRQEPSSLYTRRHEEGGAQWRPAPASPASASPSFSCSAASGSQRAAGPKAKAGKAPGKGPGKGGKNAPPKSQAASQTGGKAVQPITRWK